MEERQVSSIERRRDRQPISIPFLWEEKPGTPKKDWKHAIPSVPIKRDIDAATLPVKLVVSVPFRWEEKPGTPLQGFLPRPLHESRNLDHDDGNWIDDDDDGLMDGSSFDSEVDTCSFETDDSFSSAPSLLANGLISTMKLASAIPVLEKTYCGTLQSLGSPAAYETYHSNSSRSSISSYETGSTSLAGASFLEWLFPLLVPNSSLPDKVGTGISSSLEKNPSHKADQVQGTELLSERNSSQIRRPLLTLGEMIAMSRRRSYQKTVTNMRKQTSMDFMKRKAFGCGIFGNSNAAFNRLHRKWKTHLQLNLM